jgi:hypothetical protein
MEESDQIIKELLKKNMHKIEDDSFTGRIVKMHISKQQSPVYKPFLNFRSLIIGISFVIINIGFILLTRTNSLSVDFEFNEQYALILLIISLIFLISTWFEDFTVRKGQNYL